MNNRLRLGVAGVAVVAVAALGYGLMQAGTIGQGPSQAPAPSQAPSPSHAPSPSAAQTDVAHFPVFPGPPRPVEAGTYDLGPEFPVSISFVVPAGWLSCVNNAGLLCPADGVGGVNIFIVTNVVADNCDEWTFRDPAVGPTVDDLVTAISSLPWSGVTPPTDVTVDGFRGKEFEVTEPSRSQCSRTDHPGYWETVHSGSAIGEAPGARTRLRILDVQGTRVVIAGYYLPGTTSSEDLAEINAIIDSVRIETSPSQAPSPSAAHTAAAFPGFPGAPRPVDAGTYGVGPDFPRAARPDFPVSISFVVPAGWLSCVNNAGFLCPADGVGAVQIFIFTNVAADPCDDGTLRDPPMGPTVDDLVTAISSLPWSAVTPPTDVTVDGFRGKEFEATASTTSPCVGRGDLADRVHRRSEGDFSPGVRNRLRILDVEGTRVVISGSYLPGTTSSQDLAEINAIIDSIRIEPPGG